MSIRPYKRCVREKVYTFVKFFVVALPDNNDEYIRVSPFAVPAYEAEFYYDDKTVEVFHYMDFIKRYTSPEWAAAHIAGYRPGMKISLAHAFCSVMVHGMFDDKKANNTLHDRLSCLTRWEYYNRKW